MRPGTEPPYAPGAESVLPTEPVLKPCTCKIKSSQLLGICLLLVQSLCWQSLPCSPAPTKHM